MIHASIDTERRTYAMEPDGSDGAKSSGSRPPGIARIAPAAKIQCGVPHAQRDHAPRTANRRERNDNNRVNSVQKYCNEPRPRGCAVASCNVACTTASGACRGACAVGAFRRRARRNPRVRAQALAAGICARADGLAPGRRLHARRDVARRPVRWRSGSSSTRGVSWAGGRTRR